MADALRIFVVDEDPDSRVETRKVLQRAGLSVERESGYGTAAVVYGTARTERGCACTVAGPAATAVACVGSGDTVHCGHRGVHRRYSAGGFGLVAADDTHRCLLHGLGGGVSAAGPPGAADAGRLGTVRCRCVVRRVRDGRGAEFDSGRRDHAVVATAIDTDHAQDGKRVHRPRGGVGIRTPPAESPTARARGPNVRAAAIGARSFGRPEFGGFRGVK